MAFDDLRRALAAIGFMPATRVPPASQGRREEAEIHPAELIEHPVARAVPVGDADGLPRAAGLPRRSAATPGRGVRPPVPFPIGGRRGRGRRAGAARPAPRDGGAESRRVLVGRSEVLDEAPDLWEQCDRIVLDAEESAASRRPSSTGAVAAIDDARSRLEVAVGERFRSRSDAWLIVDGSLAESTGVRARRPHARVSKSHATLPFDGADLETYLRLPAGHRTSVFRPASRRFAPVLRMGTPALALGRDAISSTGWSGSRRRRPRNRSRGRTRSPAGCWRSGRRSARRTRAGTGCCTGSRTWKTFSRPWCRDADDRTRAPIGRVVATEQRPSTPHQFYFWTARESPVGIGAIVRVEVDRAATCTAW